MNTATRVWLSWNLLRYSYGIVIIAISLLAAGYVDVAVRDLLLAVGAFVFTELAVVQKQSNA